MTALVPMTPAAPGAVMSLAPKSAPAPAPLPLKKVFGEWRPAPPASEWVHPSARYAVEIGASFEALALALDEACFAKLAEV